MVTIKEMYNLSQSIATVTETYNLLAKGDIPPAMLEHVENIIRDLETIQFDIVSHEKQNFVDDWFDNNGTDEEPTETVDSDELDEEDWDLLCGLKHNDPVASDNETHHVVDPRCAAWHPDDTEDLICDESDVE